MDIPLVANYLQFTPANWKYKTVPSNKYCLAMENNQCNFPRGKVMGGSSVLNYMIYTRGNKRDFDNWAAMGNPGWSYRDVLPYYKKVENFSIPEYFNPEQHGESGYLSVSYSPFKTPIADAVIDAGKQMGLLELDYNAEQQAGVSRLQLSQQDGVRHSSSRAYLHPITKRPNLHVAKYTMVKKVLIDPETRRAYGVEIVRKHKVMKIYAKREVILSAGAINSPQILMLSGVGPRKHLKRFGIPVLQDSYVGFNLMDHVAVGGLTFTINRPYSLSFEKMLRSEYISDYMNNHRGPLTIPGGCETLVFSEVNDPLNPDGYPDMELLFNSGSVVSDPLLRKNFGLREDLYNEFFGPILNQETFSVFTMLMRPKSKGRVLLQSANYKDKPLIVPNYFAFQEDVDTMVKGVRLTLNLTSQPAMQAIGTRLHIGPLPACDVFPFNSDEYWGCIARHFSFTIYHQSGTCKMGPASDKRAVLDSRLRVHGISNLRVIDASFMPEIPAAHTNAPVFLAAEMGSDMIKEDWGVET